LLAAVATLVAIIVRLAGTLATGQVDDFGADFGRKLLP
jgi:hypothetical protein